MVRFGPCVNSRPFLFNAINQEETVTAPATDTDFFFW